MRGKRDTRAREKAGARFASALIGASLALLAIALPLMLAPAAQALAKAPTIDAVSSSHLTATSAELDAQINPHGADTSYRFEYGTSTEYGASAPVPDEDIGAAESDQSVSVHLTGLTEGATYHFRLIAHNAEGTATSEDQTFGFLPPACPNAAVRQQVAADYLPDCRAYELVSPPNANGTLLFPGGPNTGLATSPSRFSFVGAFSSLPGAEPINTGGDLYVATRTDEGWVSRYVGLPGSQAGCIGGPPTNIWSHTSVPSELQNAVLTDPGMSRFLDFLDGTSITCVTSGNGLGDQDWELAQASNAPYMWNAEGALLGRLPTDLGAIPGATAALSCPTSGDQDVYPACSGEATASPDLTHLLFSSNRLSFSEGVEKEGLTEAPGSAYDNDLATGAVKLISLKPNGEDLTQDPAFAKVPPVKEPDGRLIVSGGREEFLRFPAVSTDGSRVLISTATAGLRNCFERQEPTPCKRFTESPVHLYMRVADLATYEIAEDEITHEPAAVNFIGMTADGSKVFFTTAEQLLPEDEDQSVDLYMWSAEKAEHGEQPLTLISKGDDAGNPGEPGNTDECSASWTVKCGVLPYSDYSYSIIPGGGNETADSALASASGDIYFYSPELLDGEGHGVAGQQNLYDYRDGAPRYVATFAPGNHCFPYEAESVCSEGPIERMQVTPEDTHMAFITADRLTSYDNAGHTEMYSYTPATGALHCDSCNPDGQPATADVFASQDGLFLTKDGRVFFSTEESLVPQDTNETQDVYEFVEGRPQLITPGTGTAVPPPGVSVSSVYERPGLVGVSSNGTDVYFSSLDTLVPQDHNGNFLKFYDARTNGGFPYTAPPAPCAAAEECHGPGSVAPALPAQGTASRLAGGNAAPVASKPLKHKKRKRHRKARSTRHRRRGSKR